MSTQAFQNISLGQGHENHDEESGDSGKRKRTIKAQTKKEGKHFHCCDICEKQYLSFPALYTHYKQKHPQHKVSSKNTSKQNPNPPIQKMKTLLKQSKQGKIQQAQRRILMIINKSSLEIIQNLKIFQPNLGKELGKFNLGLQKMNDIKKKAHELALVINCDQKYFEREDILYNVTGKIAIFSFGGDLLKTFINSKIAIKLYLHLLALQNFESYDQELIQVEKKIWSNMNVDWKFLFQYWQQYRQTIKRFHKKQPSK